jgi:hypothetical protein
VDVMFADRSQPIDDDRRARRAFIYQGNAHGEPDTLIFVERRLTINAAIGFVSPFGADRANAPARRGGGWQDQRRLPRRGDLGAASLCWRR